MKTKMLSTAVLLGTLLAISAAAQEKEAKEAQNKEKTESTDRDRAHKTPTPVRVQIVFNEFDSDKRINSLPYTLLVNADTPGPRASIRMGIRVPVHTSSNASTYMDVGTNVDGLAERQDDGRFLLGLSVERSSLYSSHQSSSLGDARVDAEQPVVQQFRSQINLLIRDGQTQQTTISTDPVTGHVLKVDVTLNVVK
jgi:hypothetical protein